MKLTQEEIELIEKYVETGDDTIIDHVINHCWAYTFPMVQIAISFKFIKLSPNRVEFQNSILD